MLSYYAKHDIIYVIEIVMILAHISLLSVGIYVMKRTEYVACTDQVFIID